MIYKCPNCSGALKYDPVSSKMMCEHCISYFEPEEMTAETKESMLTQEEIAATAQAEVARKDDEYMECNIYSCTSCGGELMVNGLESSTFCAYCGQPTIVFNRVSKELKPQYIVPFSVTKKEAEQIIRDKLNAGFFVPKEIQEFDIERLRGIYIPYWLCDMDYRDKQSLVGTVGSGKNSKTRYYYRAARCSYKNITMDASLRLSDESSQRLEPYDTKKLEVFDPSYLSGYYADRYDVNEEMIKQVAIKRAKEMFDNEVKNSINAHDIRILENKPMMRIKEMKYTLLPAWFLTFRYQGEAYTFLVNGQTKKVVGGVPYLKSFFWILIFCLTILFTMLLYPVTSRLLELMSGINTGNELDIESIYKTCFTFFAVVCGFLYSAYQKLKLLKNSVELSKSTKMLNYVKDRQEEN